MLKMLFKFRYSLLIALLVGIQARAQTTVKTFYPTFQKFKIASKEIKIRISVLILMFQNASRGIVKMVMGFGSRCFMKIALTSERKTIITL